MRTISAAEGGSPKTNAFNNGGIRYFNLHIHLNNFIYFIFFIFVDIFLIYSLTYCLCSTGVWDLGYLGSDGNVASDYAIALLLGGPWTFLDGTVFTGSAQVKL